MRERGLKHIIYEGAAVGLVAPHAGAWIETNLAVETGQSSRSLPMRERGLKLVG